MSYQPQPQDEAHKKPSRQVNIGLLLGTINVDQPFLAGAAAAALAHNVNLVSYIGKTLNSQRNHEYQGNILYRYAARKGLDGVITWAGPGVAMGLNASKEDLNSFFDQFRTIPIINYEQPIPGLHTIRTDTTLGMETVLRHLVEVHNRRKILLLRGPQGHGETEERVRAYHNILSEFDIPLNPELIMPPLSWGTYGFEGIISQFIDQRQLCPGIDFDAVAGTEPYFAIACIRVLQQRGIDIPGEVAVVGFNDSPENTAISPPLTTVHKPFFASGYRAVESLLDLINGKEIPGEILIPADIILRRSCGCISRTIQELGPRTQDSDPLRLIETPGIEIYGLASQPPQTMIQDLENAARAISSLLPSDWLFSLWKSFLADLNDPRGIAFIDALNDLTTQSSAIETAPEVWNRILTLFRHSIRPLLNGPILDSAEILWQQARIFLAEAHLQIQHRQARVAQNQRYFLDLIGEGLNVTASLDEMQENIMRILSLLHIPSCYLSLYSDPRYPERTARLILAYKDYEHIDLPPSGRVFPAWQLIPEDLMISGRNYVLVVEPLYYHDRQLGFIVFEMTEGVGGIFELLQKRISNILDRLLVERDVREREAQFQAMAEASPIGILMVDMQGKVTYQNPVMQTMIGQIPGSLEGRTWLEACDPQDRSRVAKKWDEASREGQPFSDIGRYIAGESENNWWDVRMAPFQVDGKLQGYVGMVQDISERLKIEAALKASEERYRQMVEGQVEGIGFINPEGIFQFMNPAGESIFDVPQRTLIGRSLFDFLEEPQRSQIYQSLVAGIHDQPETYEIDIHRQDGSVRHILITAAPSFDSNQVHIGFFGTFRDITQRKKHENQLYYISTHDTLTGLHNRTYYEETLRRLKKSGQSPISVIIADVDGLKITNDTLGHAAGDLILRQIAIVLRKSFRSDDVIARIGGDEFVVILPGASENIVQRRVDGLRRNLEEHDSGDLKIDLSIGCATASEPDCLDETIHQADQAMYLDKARRRSDRTNQP